MTAAETALRAWTLWKNAPNGEEQDFIADHPAEWQIVHAILKARRKATADA